MITNPVHSHSQLFIGPILATYAKQVKIRAIFAKCPSVGGVSHFEHFWNPYISGVPNKNPPPCFVPVAKQGGGDFY